MVETMNPEKLIEYGVPIVGVLILGGVIWAVKEALGVHRAAHSDDGQE